MKTKPTLSFSTTLWLRILIRSPVIRFLRIDRRHSDMRMTLYIRSEPASPRSE